jgi:hypothetical protein
VTTGLATTFGVLERTDNQTAVRVLLPALKSPRPAIQEGALVALLNRHEIAGQREILARTSDLPHRWRVLIKENSDRLTGVLRAALVEADESLSLNACRAAVMFEDYEVIPALLAALENGSPGKIDMAVETLLQLAGQLYSALERPLDPADRRDARWSGKHVLTSLENAVQRFGRHKRREVIEAFLLLADRNNAVLSQILRSPHHVCFLILMDVFAKSEHTAVMRLLASYLDDPQAPAAMLHALAKRSDPKFVRYLLRHLGLELSAVARQNLRRIDSFDWLKTGTGIIDYLDNSGQLALVHLVLAAGIPRKQAFSTVEHLLLDGKLAGRREAAAALAAFNGADANALALSALGDPDPQVQAAILSHIRQRAIPGILPRLIKFVESPNLEVRRAAQQSLTEYSFPRFVAAFDLLDEKVQQTTGALVKKVDSQTLPLLRAELLAHARSRRIRAAQIATAMELGDAVEPLLVELLHDGDPDVRTAAAAALGNCTSASARRALEAALADRKPAVQAAASKTLGERSGGAQHEV